MLKHKDAERYTRDMQKNTGQDQEALWSFEDLARALGVPCSVSEPLCHSWQVPVTGVSLDSRTLRAGDLFIALKGPYQQGADYVSHAFERGAAAAVLSQSSDPFVVSQEKLLSERPCFMVSDSDEALRQLAHFARARTLATVIGVTGSFGKTSVKEALALILGKKGSVTASERSFNNHWGVPLTLSRLRPHDQYGIVEMGMNHAGEILQLSQLVRPHIALITTIRAMHVEHLGSLEAIADAKAEIFCGMEAGGIALLNREDPLFERVFQQGQKRGLDILSFGRSRDADVRVRDETVEGGRLKLALDFSGTVKTFSFPFWGSHWTLNIAGILGSLWALTRNIQDVVEAEAALQTYTLPEGRGARHHVFWQDGEILVIDESYNAGPDSMEAALAVLGRLDGDFARKGSGEGAVGRRIAILGDMNELGETALLQHQRLREVLLKNRIDLVFTCGQWMGHLYDTLPASLKGGHSVDVASLVPSVLETLRSGDCVLVKGSKGQYAQRGRMYGFIEAILNASQPTSTGQPAF